MKVVKNSINILHKKNTFSFFTAEINYKLIYREFSKFPCALSFANLLSTVILLL